MNEYPHIDSIFNRDIETGKFLNEYSQPCFEYLKDNEWVWTEKIDGTNIRVISDENGVSFKGRTDKAQIPEHLLKKLKELFPEEKLKTVGPNSFCLYGEGYGHKIQSGGLYLPDKSVDFILFDVKVGAWWLQREDVEEIAVKLGIKCVPIVYRGTLAQAIDATREGMKSTFGDFTMEGFVLRPKIDLIQRNGQRVITKVKHKDFK